VKLYGEPHNVHSIVYWRDFFQVAEEEAQKAYGKKRTIKEKGLQDGKRQRLRYREGKTTGSTEAGMMETKLVWDRKWTDEVKQKTRKTVSCNCSQSTVWRSKQRYRQVIKNKNFNEKAEARGLLNVVKVKTGMQIMDQSKQCSEKRAELVKNKKRLLEDWRKNKILNTSTSSTLRFKVHKSFHE